MKKISAVFLFSNGSCRNRFMGVVKCQIVGAIFIHNHIEVGVVLLF